MKRNSVCFEGAKISAPKHTHQLHRAENVLAVT